ncbi:MAG: DUF3276 family protein [Alistipes sp.]|nr:DUF3276 family protein [Alistipes sp.]
MSYDNNFSHDHDEFGEIICSKAVRAGKRTYFFDVKATQGDDYYLVITESRRRNNDDGTPTYSRHHMYLYKEDFGKFIDGLEEMINYIKKNKPDYFNEEK